MYYDGFDGTNTMRKLLGRASQASFGISFIRDNQSSIRIMPAMYQRKESSHQFSNGSATHDIAAVTTCVMPTRPTHASDGK